MDGPCHGLALRTNPARPGCTRLALLAKNILVLLIALIASNASNASKHLTHIRSALRHCAPRCPHDSLPARLYSQTLGRRGRGGVLRA